MFDFIKNMPIEQAVRFDVSPSVMRYPTECEFQYGLNDFSSFRTKPLTIHADMFKFI